MGDSTPSKRIRRSKYAGEARGLVSYPFCEQGEPLYVQAGNVLSSKEQVLSLSFNSDFLSLSPSIRLVFPPKQAALQLRLQLCSGASRRKRLTPFCWAFHRLLRCSVPTNSLTARLDVYF